MFQKYKSLYDQNHNFFENRFSKYQCGFRKDFNIQNVLLSMVEKMQLALNERDVCGAIFTYLSKAFDFISHDLIITQLNAYGFDQNALEVIYDYLSRRS